MVEQSYASWHCIDQDVEVYSRTEASIGEPTLDRTRAETIKELQRTLGGGPGTVLASGDFWRVIKDVIIRGGFHHRMHGLSAGDLAVIRSDLAAQTVYRCAQIVSVATWPVLGSAKLLGKLFVETATLQPLRQAAGWVGRFLTKRARKHNATLDEEIKRQKLLEKVRKKKQADPYYELTHEENQALFGKPAEVATSLRAKLARQVKNWFYYAHKTLIASIALAAINLQVQVTAVHSNPTSYDAYTATQGANSMAPKSHQVDIIVETTPFPHLAFRVGTGRVYSYGRTNLTATSAAEYLLNDQINRRFAAARGTQEEGGFLNNLRKSPAAQRCRIVIRLNLTEAQVSALRTRVEERKGMRYDNRTCVNDCATMGTFDINAVAPGTFPPGLLTRLIEAGPQQVAMYFAARKARGDPRVDKLFLLMRNPQNFSRTMIARNYLIALGETTWMLFNAPYDQAEKEHMRRYLSPDEIIYYTDKGKKHLQDLQKKWVDNSVTVNMAKDLQQELKDARRANDRELVKELIGEFDILVGPEIKRLRKEVAATEVFDKENRLIATAQLEALEAIQKDFRR